MADHLFRPGDRVSYLVNAKGDRVPATVAADSLAYGQISIRLDEPMVVHINRRRKLRQYRTVSPHHLRPLEPKGS